MIYLRPLPPSLSFPWCPHDFGQTIPRPRKWGRNYGIEHWWNRLKWIYESDTYVQLWSSFWFNCSGICFWIDVFPTDPTLYHPLSAQNFNLINFLFLSFGNGWPQEHQRYNCYHHQPHRERRRRHWLLCNHLELCARSLPLSFLSWLEI